MIDVIYLIKNLYLSEISLEEATILKFTTDFKFSSYSCLRNQSNGVELFQPRYRITCLVALQCSRAGSIIYSITVFSCCFYYIQHCSVLVLVLLYTALQCSRAGSIIYRLQCSRAGSIIYSTAVFTCCMMNY